MFLLLACNHGEKNSNNSDLTIDSSFYTNGSIESIGKHDFLGRREGELIVFRQSGDIELKSTFNKGKLVGDLTSYYTNGCWEKYKAYDQEENQFFFMTQDSLKKMTTVNGSIVSPTIMTTMRLDSINVRSSFILTYSYACPPSYRFVYQEPVILDKLLAEATIIKVTSDSNANQLNVELHPNLPGVYRLKMKAKLIDEQSRVIQHWSDTLVFTVVKK